MLTKDYVIQLNEPDEFDTSVLRKPLFPVNMRLYKTSQYFKEIIKNIANYMRWKVFAKMEDYGEIKGTSGANLGIPWSIIGVKKVFSASAAECQIFINPVITKRSTETVVVKSNCGSLRLKNPIEIKRNVWIDLEWYDLEGNKRQNRTITRTDGGFTIQHEVDHCNGILITDRHAELNESMKKSLTE